MIWIHLEPREKQQYIKNENKIPVFDKSAGAGIRNLRDSEEVQSNAFRQLGYRDFRYWDLRAVLLLEKEDSAPPSFVRMAPILNE
ncbi:hypothetical protein TNCV_1985911 [Trichonephila clavipes]|nr:hypothetical protein TNCV_1985911 [Trichonephila clavipes]